MNEKIPARSPQRRLGSDDPDDGMRSILAAAIGLTSLGGGAGGDSTSSSVGSSSPSSMAAESPPSPERLQPVLRAVGGASSPYAPGREGLGASQSPSEASGAGADAHRAGADPSPPGRLPTVSRSGRHPAQARPPSANPLWDDPAGYPDDSPPARQQQQELQRRRQGARQSGREEIEDRLEGAPMAAAPSKKAIGMALPSLPQSSRAMASPAHPRQQQQHQRQEQDRHPVVADGGRGDSEHPASPRDPSLSFPELLYDVLSSPSAGASGAISWLPDGRGFAILDRERFSKAVLTERFDGSKFTSFARRLKRWGFERMPRNGVAGAADCYRNRNFIKGRPDLVASMIYGGGATDQQRARTDPDDDESWVKENKRKRCEQKTGEQQQKTKKAKGEGDVVVEAAMAQHRQRRELAELEKRQRETQQAYRETLLQQQALLRKPESPPPLPHHSRQSSESSEDSYGSPAKRMQYDPRNRGLAKSMLMNGYHCNHNLRGHIGQQSPQQHENNDLNRGPAMKVPLAKEPRPLYQKPTNGLLHADSLGYMRLFGSKKQQQHAQRHQPQGQQTHEHDHPLWPGSTHRCAPSTESSFGRAFHPLSREGTHDWEHDLPTREGSFERPGCSSTSPKMRRQWQHLQFPDSRALQRDHDDFLSMAIARRNMAEMGALQEPRRDHNTTINPATAVSKLTDMELDMELRRRRRLQQQQKLNVISPPESSEQQQCLNDIKRRVLSGMSYPELPTTSLGSGGSYAWTNTTNDCDTRDYAGGPAGVRKEENTRKKIMDSASSGSCDRPSRQDGLDHKDGGHHLADYGGGNKDNISLFNDSLEASNGSIHTNQAMIRRILASSRTHEEIMLIAARELSRGANTTPGVGGRRDAGGFQMGRRGITSKYPCNLMQPTQCVSLSPTTGRHGQEMRRQNQYPPSESESEQLMLLSLLKVDAGRQRQKKLLKQLPMPSGERPQHHQQLPSLLRQPQIQRQAQLPTPPLLRQTAPSQHARMMLRQLEEKVEQETALAEAQAAANKGMDLHSDSGHGEYYCRSETANGPGRNGHASAA